MAIAVGPEAKAALFVAVLTAVCIRATVHGDTPVDRRRRRVAMAKSFAVALVVTYAVAYFVRHPAPADPVRACVLGDPDF